MSWSPDGREIAYSAASKSGFTAQYLTRIWEDWRGALFGRMREEGRLDLLDHYVGKDGLDVTQIGTAIRNAYERKYGTNYTGQFGPPSYVSAQVIMTAVSSLCAAHKKITRAAVVAAIRKVKLKKTILGSGIAFDRHGDVVGGKFYIYKLVNGSYQLVP